MIISICTTHTTAWENLFASRALQQTQVVSDGPAKEPSVVRGLFGLVWADDAFARGRVGHRTTSGRVGWQGPTGSASSRIVPRLSGVAVLALAAL
jgi:hypothetical protein